MGVTIVTHNGVYGRRPHIKYYQHRMYMIRYRSWVCGMRVSGHAARTRGALLSQRAFELQDENSEPVFWLQAGFGSLRT